ncbi:MAG TPA: PHP-associated domain-containing protein [Acidobacteriota bacterium]|jgi:hypothetical protein
MAILKVELHTHTSDDPEDHIPHSATDLIDRAAGLGYQVLAITLHNRQLRSSWLEGYARDRGLLLMPGVERTLFGKHILLINFPEEAAQVRSFEEIAVLKSRCDGLVVAPHPFYPSASCLRELLDRYRELFDAVEINHFYTRTIDFNRRAWKWAQANGKGVVGNSDVHHLSQLGKTYSLVDSEPTAESVCDAIRKGRVEIRSNPLTWLEIGSITGQLAVDRILHGLQTSKPQKT